MQRTRYLLQLCYAGLLGTLIFNGSIGMSEPPKQTVAQSLSAQEKDLLKQFQKQAKDYIAKEHALPADNLKPKTDIAVLDQQRLALRQALQQSRPDAKQGDLFTPRVSDVFRKLLAQTLSGAAGTKIKASLNHAEPTAPVSLSVNGAYPNANGQPIQSIPPTLLLNLPVLPKGLEYCIVGKTLALRDTDANMVVDFLPHALP